MDKEIVNFLLQWADNSLILGQRLSEWCGHGPALEQDIAITNIALDLIGEARNLYQTIAQSEGGNKTEDYYPYLRKENQFINTLLVEQPNVDWAYTIVRQFMFDCHHYFFLSALTNSENEKIKSLALKSQKEARYHLRYSSEWILRLGEGTEVSNQKTQVALNHLAKFFNELFELNSSTLKLIEANEIIDLFSIEEQAKSFFFRTIKQANLNYPENVVSRKGGKSGIHSEHMGYILSDLQFLQRTYPNAKW